MLSSKVVERKIEVPGEVSGSLGTLEPLYLCVPIKVSHGEDETAVGQQGQQLRRKLDMERRVRARWNTLGNSAKFLQCIWSQNFLGKNDCRFIFALQISHNFFFWPTLTLKDRGEGNLGKVVQIFSGRKIQHSVIFKWMEWSLLNLFMTLFKIWHWSSMPSLVFRKV